VTVFILTVKFLFFTSSHGSTGQDSRSRPNLELLFDRTKLNFAGAQRDYFIIMINVLEYLYGRKDTAPKVNATSGEPCRGDPNPSRRPNAIAGHQTPQARGRWLMNLINSMHLLVLNGRSRNIAPSRFIHTPTYKT
jgi:hypothetical protein